MDVSLLLYVWPFGVVLAIYLARRWRHETRSRRVLTEAIASGLNEPSSLHPIIDASRCVGCKACVRACPESEVLGIVDGKAALIQPGSCIGHGACKSACPRDAISLVFGTATRGVDLPLVKSNFETNVSGLYIAGELGGMGLIRNAIRQGSAAIANIAREPRSRSPALLDVVVVGAGPAGFAASLAAMEHGLNFVTLEQDSFGGTVAQFPRGKIVMTAPAQLPIVGSFEFREIEKEKLLDIWTDAANRAGLRVNYGERVIRIDRTDGGFGVETERGIYRSRHVLLAIGRRGTPRKLDVPGEELPKVVYRLVDPEQYAGRDVLVVGGGDSALEAATSLADDGGAQVTLSYRGNGFSRAKAKNRKRIETLAQGRRLHVLLESDVLGIDQGSVLLSLGGQVHQLRNDAVIVCAGGILPTEFLRSAGVEIETHHGMA